MIRLIGAYDQAVAERLEGAVTGALAGRAKASLLVIVDLRGLTDSHIFARTVLVRIQREISSYAKRTAYVADRPRFRGLALWVVHLAEDGNARAVVSDEQIEEWFSSTEERIDGAETRYNAAVAAVAKGGPR